MGERINFSGIYFEHEMGGLATFELLSCKCRCCGSENDFSLRSESIANGVY